MNYLNFHSFNKCRIKSLRFSILILLGVNSIFNNHVFAQSAGSLDVNFNTQGYTTDDLGLIDVYNKVLIQSDQKIIAVGMSWDDAYIAKVVVSRYLENGLLDLSFGFSGVFTYNLDIEALAYDAVLSPEGKIIVVGTTTDYSKYRILLLQLNSDGSLDTDFGDNGVVTTITGLAAENGEDMAYGVDLDASGNIIVSGSSYDENSLRRPIVIRYSPTGVFDSDFGVNGIATIPITNNENTFDCLAVQSDGKIIAAGHYAENLLYFVFLMVRFNADGSLDNTFGDNGIIKNSFSNVDDEGYNMAIRPDGKILVAGFSGSQTYNYNSLLVQYTTDGQLDSSFGVNGVASVDVANYDVAEDVKVLPNGDLIVIGTSGDGPPNAYHLAVWKYKANGSLDTEFGTNGLVQHQIDDYYVMLHSMAIQDDGKLVVAGQARGQDSNNDLIVCRMHLNNPSGIMEADLNNSFDIYPNPSAGTNQIKFINNSINSDWNRANIYSITGQLIHSIVRNKSNNSIDLPFNISSGVYFISLENNGIESKAKKLIITNN